MTGLRSPPTTRIKSVPIKLTADSGAQVTACNVDKLPLLGLRKKDLLTTAVGLECANKEDANVLGVFFGSIVAKISGGNDITVLGVCDEAWWRPAQQGGLAAVRSLTT